MILSHDCPRPDHQELLNVPEEKHLRGRWSGGTEDVDVAPSLPEDRVNIAIFIIVVIKKIVI